MSDAVPFAAWIPAIFATVRTSPLATRFSATASNPFRLSTSAPRATASRSDPAFPETSTIRTSPFASTWHSSAARLVVDFTFARAGIGSASLRRPREGEGRHLHRRHGDHRLTRSPARDAHHLHRGE